jgi:hypothetical protein
VYASQSQPAAGDDEEVPIDQEIPTRKKRKQGNPSGDSEDVSIDQDSLPRKKNKSGEAFGDDEEASTEENSLARESRKPEEDNANHKEVSTNSGEASDDEGTSATNGLYGSSVKITLAEEATGT